MKIISPLSSHTIQRDFAALYNKSMREGVVVGRTTPSRILSLRPSQMPFCPLSFFWTTAIRGLYRDLDMRGAYYTSVGTTVHEVMQNFLCRTGKFFADYYCRECDTWHRRSYTHECCEFPTQYHEIEINYKGVVGHIDGVYKDDKSKLWILDFKTTSIAGAESKKKNPGIVYREQIETYAFLFELQYKKRIEGIMDAFIMRDNPEKSPSVWAVPFTDDTRRQVKGRLIHYKKGHRAALDANSKRDVLDLMDFGRCHNPDCKICKHSDEDVKTMLLDAFKKGKAKGNVTIRDMAERELERIKKASKVWVPEREEAEA